MAEAFVFLTITGLSAYVTKAATKTVTKWTLDTSQLHFTKNKCHLRVSHTWRRLDIWGTILEQAGHQGLPKIEPFGILAWKIEKSHHGCDENSVSSGDPRQKRRAPGEIR